MGFKLRREVRDNLPPGKLSASERLLVLEIADQADDDTRRAFPGVELLAKFTDIPTSKVGGMLASIAENWTELRVPLGKGKDGRPYYSRPKRRTTFEFPPADELASVTAAALKAPRKGRASKAPQYGVPEGTQDGVPKAPPNGKLRPPNMGGPSPHGSPQRPSSTNSSSSGRSPNVAWVCGHTDADDDEARSVLEEVKTRHEPRSLGAYIRGMQPEDLADILDEVRAAEAADDYDGPSREEFRDLMAFEPACEHGEPGGHYRWPKDGKWSTCAIRRKQQKEHDAWSLASQGKSYTNPPHTELAYEQDYLTEWPKAA